MAALVRVPDLRRRHRQRPFHGAQDNRLGQRLVEFPTEHIATVPVEPGDQVEPAPSRADLGDIHAPALIWAHNRPIAQQVGLDRVLRRALAQVRAGVQRRQTQLGHVASDRLAMDGAARAGQWGSDAPRPVNRAGRIDFVHAVRAGHLLRRGLTRVLIEAAAADAQAHRLLLQREVRVRTVDQGPAGGPTQLAGQLCFPATSIAW